MKRRQRRKSRRRKPPGRILPWLGLGALGLATYWMTRREPAGSESPPLAGVPPGKPSPPPTELPDDVEFAWIPGPFGTLRVAERHPQGRLALILVHGLAGRLEHWAPVIRALGPGLRTLAVDLPGHGESDPARPPDYTVPALASSVAAVAEGFALRRSVLVAHSLGALAAVEFASRHADRVSGLLLVDPSGDQSSTRPADKKVLLEAIRKDPRGECDMNYRHFLADARPEVARQVMEDLESTSEDVLVRALEGSADYAAMRALESYPGPVASVVSEANDSPISLHRLDRGLRVWHLPRASHWLMMDRPQEILEILWRFLEEIRS